MADNKDLYLEMDNIIQAEQNNGSVGDERKEAVLKRLQELADQGNDFDPDRLDGIIALASGNTSDIAKSVLQRATEQKNNLSAQNDEANNTSSQTQDESLLDRDVNILCQPSYNVRKEYERLSAKETLTEEEKSTKQKIEKNIETYLSSVNDVTEDNVVAIMDYLAVSEMSGFEEVKNRNDNLGQRVGAVASEYDKQNGLESLEGKDAKYIEDNLEKWKSVAVQLSKEQLQPSSSYAGILNSLSVEDQKKMQEFMLMKTLHSLKVNPPSSLPAGATEEFSKKFGDACSEYALLINEEYLKQEAMDDFCKQNNITTEKLNAILEKASKGGKLTDSEQKLQNNYNVQLKAYLEKAPSFNGPYKNKEFLNSAIAVVNGITIADLRSLDCRIAQKVNAPRASKEVTEENNNFAKKHPKLALAINFAKGMGASMAIGAFFGPVGLTVYSACKTAGAIKKSYNRFKESSGKSGIKSYLQHLVSREGRVEALALAGSVAATCVSGYFTVLPGLENIQNLDLGMVGNFVGNTGGAVEAAAQTATQTATQTMTDATASVAEATAPSVLGSVKAGFNSIIQSPRRVISMTSSLGIGVTKGVAAWNNLRYARKQLADVFAKAGINVDKKTLRSLEGIDKNTFYQRLQQIAPNFNDEQVAEAFKHVTLANNSNPKSEFLSATIGAGIGLGLAAATDYYQDSANYINAQNVETDGVDTSTTGTSEIPTVEIEGDNAPPHMGDEIWQYEGAADQRFESFGIDAKGANEMLRDMGIIKEGDNHFYRQSELNNLVNNTELTAEQKATIQLWADDRDSRVDAMLKWQAEHPTYQAPEPEISEPAPLFKEPIPDIKDTLPEKLTGTMYNVQGKIDGQNFQMNVLADNPVEAGLIASEMADENGFLDKKSSIEVRGDGVVTEIEQKVKDDYVSTKVTTRDLEGDKIATQTIKTYDNGVMESKFKGDIDGDGRNDTITRVTGADGTSVSHEKFGNGERAVSYTNANGETTEVTSQEMEENGVKRVNSQLKKAYKEIAEDIRENSANEQTNAGLGVSSAPVVENTNPPVNNSAPTVENTNPPVNNSAPVVENTTVPVTPIVSTTEVQTTDSNITYKFSENGSFTMEGNIQGVNVQKLMPEITTSENASGSTVYKCGNSTALTASLARHKESAALMGLCARNEVYNDLQSRASNGEVLGQAEQRWMTRHETELRARGLEVKDGEITRSTSVREGSSKGVSGLFKKGRDR